MNPTDPRQEAPRHFESDGKPTDPAQSEKEGILARGAAADTVRSPGFFSTPERPLDPELVGLLEELADQDGRQLLARLSQWKNPASPTVADRLRPGSPFLSNLERHLLDVYRDDLGLLVEEACLDLFLSAPAFAHSVQPNRDVDGRLILPRDRAALRADRDRLEPLVADDPPCGAALDILRRLWERPLDGGPQEKSELLVLALAGSRVRPSDVFEIYTALGFGLIGDLVEAERRILNVYHNPVRYTRKAVAACNLGKISESRGRLSDSMAWYRRGATLKQTSEAGLAPWALSAASWAVAAILLGDLSQAREAFQHLSEELPPKDPTIQAYCHRLRADRFTGTWVPDERTYRPILECLPENLDNEKTKAIRAVFE